MRLFSTPMVAKPPHIEAIFLGLYLYGWDRLSPRAHWLRSFPIWISGAASAWFID